MRVTRFSIGSLLALALFLTAGGCEVQEPIGEPGIRGRAELTHTLEGPLRSVPVAVGTRFLISASRDGCDRLREVCDDAYGELLVKSGDPDIFEITVRSDGRLGALAKSPGSVLLSAVDGDERVVDQFAVEVALPSSVGLTDQPQTARVPRALPAVWGVRASENVELRAALLDADRRVLLSGDDARIVTLEERDFDVSLFFSTQVELGERVRLRPPAAPAEGRVVVRPADGSVDARVHYVTVEPEVGHGRVRLELMGFAAQPEYGLVEIDLCAVRELGGVFQVGHGFRWTAPAGFVVRDMGIGAFPDEPPEGSRCVRAVRWDDRDVGPNERISAVHGPAKGELPFGVVQQRVAQPTPWHQPLQEKISEAVTTIGGSGR